MKDPLHIEQTPYEVLGLDPGSFSQEAVNRAYVAALGRRVPPNKAKAARDALSNPTDQTWNRLLEFDGSVVSRLSPNPVDDPSVLNPALRGATASAWETHFKANYPGDHATAHCLAVLFYWWAIYQEDQLAEAVKNLHAIRVDEVSSLLDAWRGAIAYWSMLIETPEFWRDGIGVSPAEESALKQKLKDTLLSRLQERALEFKYHNLIAADYWHLQASLAAELESAKIISKYGAKTQRGKIRAGLMMLQRLGYLEKLRNLIEEAYRKNPQDEQMIKVRTVLSPYLPIDNLIRSNKPDEALMAIHGLATTEQELPEVCELRAHALFLQGKHHAEVGNLEQALKSWETALETRDIPHDLRKQIESEVVTTCHSRATSLQTRQLDDAIATLELGLTLVPNAQKLEETLAELLTRRGIAACNKEQEKLKAAMEKGPEAFSASTKEGIRILEGAVKDFSRAKDLGSPRAQENLEAAQQLLDMLKTGGAIGPTGKPLPTRLVELLSKAKEAKEKGNWVDAIGYLREALKVRGFENDEQIKKSLAVCLANHGIEQANRAVENLNKTARERENLPQWIADLLKKGPHLQADCCAMCGKSLYSLYSPQPMGYVIKLPDGTNASICVKCKDILRDLSAVPLKPSPESINLLRSGEKELKEALRLDPSNEHAEKNLQEVRGILSEFEKHEKEERRQERRKKLKRGLIPGFFIFGIPAGFAIIAHYVFGQNWKEIATIVVIYWMVMQGISSLLSK